MSIPVENKANEDTSNDVKIQLSFHKKSYSDLTKNYLCGLMDPNEDNDLITQLSSLMEDEKKSLKVKVANMLLKKILKAIVINDEMEDEKFEPDQDSEGDEETDSDDDKDPPTQIEADVTIGKKPKSPANNKNSFCCVKIPATCSLSTC